MSSTTPVLSSQGTPDSPAVASDRETVSRRERHRHLTWPRHILVATDGSGTSDAAIETAKAFAERGADRRAPTVEMLTVYSPYVPMPPSPDRSGFENCERPDRQAAAHLLRAVRHQRRRMVGRPREWPLHLEVGDPGTVVVRTAGQVGADLVIVGIGEPNPDDRSVGTHTALRAAQHLTVPMYAAACGCGAPTRCLVMLPDGRAHAPTLRTALTLVPSGGHVVIALPDDPSSPVDEAMRARSGREILADACGPEIADFAEAMELARVDVMGDMLGGVLRLAGELNVDVIAVPNRGAPGPVRSFLPNLVESVLRAARCSVLVVPD